MSCGDYSSCSRATIPYVVGPSCTGQLSCNDAQIGSAYRSCTEYGSCDFALLSGVDLIDSCNKEFSCRETNGKGEITELVGCCIDKDYQCFGREGDNIVADGCVSYVYIDTNTAFDCLFIFK